MSALIVDVLKVAVIGLVVLFVWDVWQLVRKQSSALDRDQTMLNSIVEIPITNHYDDADEVDVFDIDITMDERDAVLQFVENFRRMKEQHGTEDH